MSGRVELHQAFAERFHAGKRFRMATEVQLADAEASLGVLWPESYRQFARSYGAVYCPGLLDLVAQKSGLADVQQFLLPKQSVTETRRWGLEPEGGCAAFASDCSGSFFAFRQLPSIGPRPDDAAVWLFDHDVGKVIKQAATFDKWLGRFLGLRQKDDVEYRFQVVVQFPETFFASSAEIEAFGQKLSESMPRTHSYDGFDAGSGTVNYFICSNTPNAVLANFRKYLGTNKVEKKVRIAHREVQGEEFTVIWPKRDDRPFDYDYE